MKKGERPRKRLAIFLDGTWNDRDDSTNIRHLHTLTIEGEVDGVRQLLYYDEGVGTGLLDGLTGGGFGFGLEGKVRSAYNWLVEHYEEGDEVYADDEVFIFGFSRGAFTARSLVSFIALCGLLRRGAPLTVSQLWKNYRILGRLREKRPENWWERLVGREEMDFRERRKIGKKPKDFTEELVADWSRRIDVTYLGIFDTVGAMGWDALAIPGLRSRVALHHNMRPTALIRTCRHALAIDEHRTSFRQTPLLDYWSSSMRPKGADDKRERSKGTQQRWFVGAHSNVGGGYANNPLASRPLEWVLDGARDAGLVTEAFTHDARGAAEQKRDSYREFLKSVWAQVIRSKRKYRRIMPPPDVRAVSDSEKAGYSLVAINEDLHPSVADLAGRDDRYAPPNLVEALQRTNPESPPRVASPHRWLAATLGGALFLVAWAILATRGLPVAVELMLGPTAGDFSFPSLAFFAAVLILLDWGESRLNHAVALSPEVSSIDAMRQLLTRLRFLAVALVLCGVVGLIRDVFFTRAVQAETVAIPSGDELAGKLVLLVFFLFVMRSSWTWMAQPMKRSGLGSIVSLQKVASNKAVGGVLDGWSSRLVCSWISDEEEARRLAESRMRELVSASLWRDLVGLVPAYTALFAAALWIALGTPSVELFVGAPFTWLPIESILEALAGPMGPGLPLGFGLVIALALTDVVENVVHLSHVRRYPRPSRWVWVGVLATLVKTLVFGLASLATAIVVLALAKATLLAEPAGMRWWLMVTAIIATVVLLISSRLVPAMRHVWRYLKRANQTEAAD